MRLIKVVLFAVSVLSLSYFISEGKVRFSQTLIIVPNDGEAIPLASFRPTWPLTGIFEKPPEQLPSKVAEPAIPITGISLFFAALLVLYGILGQRDQEFDRVDDNQSFAVGMHKHASGESA